MSLRECSMLLLHSSQCSGSMVAVRETTATASTLLNIFHVRLKVTVCYSNLLQLPFLFTILYKSLNLYELSSWPGNVAEKSPSFSGPFCWSFTFTSWFSQQGLLCRCCSYLFFGNLFLKFHRLPDILPVDSSTWVYFIVRRINFLLKFVL